MIIIESDSFHKKSSRTIFLYFIKDSEIIFTEDNKTIKIVDLYQRSIKQLDISKSLFINMIFEIAKKCNVKNKKDRRIGELIFNAISNDLKYDN